MESTMPFFQHAHFQGAKSQTVDTIEEFEIEFPNQLNVPFIPSPVVVASYDPTNDQIHASIIVFLPTAVDLPEFHVHGLFNINPAGLEQLQFFVVTDYPETTISQTFKGYRFDFKANREMLPTGVHFNQIVTIQGFLWNKDPKTSRGTVTTVIHSA
ncbi:MAG: hypothetical protein V4604_03050 [Bacteroidota bacterium]